MPRRPAAPPPATRRASAAARARGVAGMRASRASVAHGFSSRQTLPNSTLIGTSPTHHTTNRTSGAMFEFSRVEPNAAAAQTNRNAASTSARPTAIVTGVQHGAVQPRGRRPPARRRSASPPTSRARGRRTRPIDHGAGRPEERRDGDRRLRTALDTVREAAEPGSRALLAAASSPARPPCRRRSACRPPRSRRSASAGRSTSASAGGRCRSCPCPDRGS